MDLKEVDLAERFARGSDLLGFKPTTNSPSTSRGIDGSDHPNEGARSDFTTANASTDQSELTGLDFPKPKSIP